MSEEIPLEVKALLDRGFAQPILAKRSDQPPPPLEIARAVRAKRSATDWLGKFLLVFSCGGW